MGRPKITLKLATSLDGRIALANGESQWITSSASRARVHQMRAMHDAVLVGIGTVLADDPLLTARTVPAPARQPVRIVADSHVRTPAHARLVQTAGLGRVVLAVAQPEKTVDPLLRSAVDIWALGEPEGAQVCLPDLLARCEVEGIQSVFLEGGGRLAASFISLGLVDQLIWFRAPVLLGGDGIPAIAALGLNTLHAAPAWRLAATERIGEDVLETYLKAD